MCAPLSLAIEDYVPRSTGIPPARWRAMWVTTVDPRILRLHSSRINRQRYTTCGMTLRTDSAGWEIGADGELMATDRQLAGGRGARPWWRPLAYSAASAAAIAALFNPIPAAAAPDVPPLPLSRAVPDAGSRPIPLGTLVMPG